MITARTEPCGCRGSDCRRLIVEWPGGKLVDMCEWAYELHRGCTEGRPLALPIPDPAKELVAALDPRRDIPQKWLDALDAMGD